jgi:hypothetical protein
MIHTLAQTTQSAFSTWTAQDWVILIGAVTAGIATILSAFAKFKADTASKAADKAQAAAETAHVTAAAANAKSDVNTERVSNIGNQVAAIGLATTPRTNGGDQPRIQT